MGGFFSTPKAPPAPAPQSAAPSAEDEARRERLQTIQRLRRGRAGLTATGNGGLLQLRGLGSERKSLLGE